MEDRYLYVSIAFYTNDQRSQPGGGDSLRSKPEGCVPGMARHNSRKTPPCLSNGSYRPHLVVKGCDHYLGVQFVEGEERALGQTVLAKAKLVYDGVDYSALRAGTAYFLVEGVHCVGEGWVIERAEGSSG